MDLIMIFKDNWPWFVLLGILIFFSVKNAFYKPKPAPPKAPDIYYVGDDQDIALITSDNSLAKDVLTKVLELESQGYVLDASINVLYPNDMYIILRKKVNQ